MPKLGSAVSATSIVFEFGEEVTIPSKYPARYEIEDEAVYVTGGSGTRYLSVTRGADDTVAVAHAVGTDFTSAPIGDGGGGGIDYVQSGDPGAVGAGKLWLDTTFSGDQSTVMPLYRRIADDTGWQPIGVGTVDARDQSFGVQVTSATPDIISTIVAGAAGDIDITWTQGADQTNLNVTSPALGGVTVSPRLGINNGGSTIPVLTSGDADPSAGGGVAEPVGSLYLRTNGQLWIKTGAGNTAWSRVTAV